MDTRDLIERREELKERILTNFQETFPQYEVDTYEDSWKIDAEEVDDWWQNIWLVETEEIEAIDNLENEVGSEFIHGITLIEEEGFDGYCEELLKECGYISDDFPSWIKIDWTETADNMRVDYSEAEFQGITYLYRA